MFRVLQGNHAWRGTDTPVQAGLGTELQMHGVVRALGRERYAKQHPTSQRFMPYLGYVPSMWVLLCVIVPPEPETCCLSLGHFWNHGNVKRKETMGCWLWELPFSQETSCYS